MIFASDSALGYLTASPKNLGTALDLHAWIITHGGISQKSKNLLMKNYKCEISKLSKRNFNLRLARTLVPNMSENDAVNMFLDCIEWALTIIEEDDEDEGHLLA